MIYYQDSHTTIHLGDCREILPTLDAAAVHTCVTSPPYFGLRDYQGEHQIGLEPTPRAYVAEMAGVFGAVWRVLRDDGTTWLNLGDSYNGLKVGNTNGGASSGLKRDGRAEHSRQSSNELLSGHMDGMRFHKPLIEGLKPKDLIGIPWRVAFALQDAGWYLRSDIIWAKGNPMPESVTDRPTKAHEYLFLLAKAERYYYDADAIREPIKPETASHVAKYTLNLKKGVDSTRNDRDTLTYFGDPAGRNKRSVWSINTQPYAGAHFAVFPEKLIEPCILAGCPAQVCAACGAPWGRVVERSAPSYYQERKEREFSGRKVDGNTNYTSISKGRPENSGVGYSSNATTGWQPSCQCNAATIPGTVLDPFGGSGTTARVAKRLGRKSILIEQNEAYCEMAAASLVQQAFPLEVFA